MKNGLLLASIVSVFKFLKYDIESSFPKATHKSIVSSQIHLLSQHCLTAIVCEGSKSFKSNLLDIVLSQKLQSKSI